MKKEVKNIANPFFQIKKKMQWAGEPVHAHTLSTETCICQNSYCKKYFSF